MDRQLRKIIKQCQQNDRKAQFDLYHLCFEKLLGICLRYKRNREDAVALLNDGFLKILLALNDFDPKREFSPWAATIMVRTAIDDFRTNRSYAETIEHREQDWQIEEAALNDKHEEVLDDLSWQDLQKMIFSLPEQERMVFNLFEWEGYSHREIALKLEVSERSCKRYLASAKQNLRKMIEKQSNLKKVI